MSDKVTVNNPKAASVVTGIPFSIIKLCQARNADGCNANGTINTEKLQAYYELHKEELIAMDSESKEQLQKEKLRTEIERNRLDIKARERELIEPEDVKALLVEIRTAEDVILKRIMSELPPRGAGKTEGELKLEVDKCINEYFKVIDEKLAKMK